MKKKLKIKKVLLVLGSVSGIAFTVLSFIAKKKKSDSIYSNQVYERNPMEGKRVIFVEDEKDDKNADGMCGHLEAVGEAKHKMGVYEKYVKRGLDIVLSFGGLIVLSPVFAVVSLAIYIDDPGPVLFTQKRIGQNKQYFKLHKFRSMKMSTPHDVPTHMLDNPEQYITRVGGFCRRHSIDELPQIWDIFIGNMSVIGPRPALWNQDVLIAERDKYGANDIRPGLTGWAQINGRDELEIGEKAKLDGDYVENIGLNMDVKVFLKSVHVIGNDDSIVEGGTGENNKEESVKVTIPENVMVSIIIATYKRDQSLERALNSLVVQTYKNFEVIIVDDNDNFEWTQKVSSIVNRFTEQLNINYIINEKNIGSAATRNRGIAEAKGEYITFLDDDDVYLSKKIEMQLKDMIASDADYGITDLNLYNDNNELIDKRERFYIKNTDVCSLMRYHLLHHMTGTDTFMFKTEYLRSIGGFLGIDVGDEYYLMKQAILAGGKFNYSNHCYIKAYVHLGESNGLSSGDSKINGENKLFEEKKKYFEYLSKEDIRFVKMRHYAVIAFAELRRRKIMPFVTNAIKSFKTSPISCIKLFLKHR